MADWISIWQVDLGNKAKKGGNNEHRYNIIIR